jgi:diazepam-binding inhibitor (GABA receptor modulating acyl-CoA-binding protein)
MNSNSKDFLNAADSVKKLTFTPKNDELLTLYGLYKQAVDGDINSTRPSFLYYREQKKWDAWNNCKGMNRESAEAKYIQLVNTLFKNK